MWREPLHSNKLVAVFLKNMSFRSLGDDMMGGMVRALSEVRRRRGLTLFFYDRNDSLDAFVDTDDWRAYLGALGSIPASDPRAVAAWGRLERRLPCVTFLSSPLGETPHRHYVGIDERGAAGLLVDHVVSEGARSIGWCSFGAESFSRARFAGFKDALARHGRALPQAWVHGYTAESGAPLAKGARRASKAPQADRLAAYRRLLVQKARPDAILCDGDQAAVELSAEARRLGIRVPEDLMVTGFDDSRAYLGARPELTTIHQDFGRIARAALFALLDLADRPRPGPTAMLLPPRLVVRASSSRGRAAAGSRGEGELRRELNRQLDLHLLDPAPGQALAAGLGLSTPYFLRRWRALMGKPFVKELNARRLARAARALRHSRKSVTHVYLECGYSNHVHFNKQFKRAYGRTARAYRKIYQKG